MHRRLWSALLWHVLDHSAANADVLDWCVLLLGYSRPPSAQKDRRPDDFYAPRDRYPYVVSLQHPNTGLHFCVGTLVMKQWILTFARCVDTKRFSTAVRNPVVALGSESIVGPFRERHTVELVIIHPLYDGLELGPYDVALLKLAAPSKQQPLVQMHSGSPPLLSGLETRAMSWSRLGEGGPYSKKLLEISGTYVRTIILNTKHAPLPPVGLEIIDDEDCFKRHDFPANISCLRVSNGDICAGGWLIAHLCYTPVCMSRP